jgi:hypothetical protein
VGSSAYRPALSILRPEADYGRASFSTNGGDILKKIIFAVLTCLFLVAGCETTPDPVETGVTAALKKDQYVGKFDIKPDNDNFGEVTLTGKVNNDFQKYQAEAVAKKVSGVKTVVNKITLN